LHLRIKRQYYCSWACSCSWCKSFWRRPQKNHCMLNLSYHLHLWRWDSDYLQLSRLEQTNNNRTALTLYALEAENKTIKCT